jgi:beta-lactamase regulating signal transducer with metallopeptidase domain
LGGIVASWLWLLVSPYLPSLPVTGVPIADLASTRRFSWSFSIPMSAAASNGVYRALWAYAIILALLLLRFCGHFWKVKNLLRASQKSPGRLAALFESVRSASGAPQCEIRLVSDLRSPATTGWWQPKVLLPRELVPRLGTQQLMHILRHELEHVRRRDYLWDRLSTLGCYLTFFHPMAWLARRRLRWERELVCDENVVQGWRADRVEYASCLTTLASWWFVEEEAAGHVDFLSSPPSLLGTRVRALLAQPTPYSSGKKIALILLLAGALFVPMLLVPEIALSSYRPALSLVPDQVLLTSGRTIARVQRGRASRHRKHLASVAPATAVQSWSTAPNFNFPVQLPILSPSSTDQGHPSESGSTEIPSRSSASNESSSNSRSPGAIWDESRPQTARQRGSKIGAVALRIVRAGIGLAATQIGDHEHEKER